MSINKDFSPAISHPFFFIRKGLYGAMNKYAGLLNGVLLDFGCGQKPYKSLFHVKEYIGIDFENPGHDHKNEQIDIFYNGINIPFGNDYFDSILCSEVFEHLFDLDKTLSEMNRVLKVGGKLLVTCPFVWNEHEIPHDYARYTTYALKHLFEKKGFAIVEYEKKGNFIQAITQLRVLYFFHNFSPTILKFPMGKYLNSVIIGLLNLYGIFWNSLFPKRFDIYLSNIFLVEKL